MTECTGAKRMAEMSRQIEDAYEKRHRIKEGYYDYGVVPYEDTGMWTRYRKWVFDWIAICRAVRGLGRLR